MQKEPERGDVMEKILCIQYGERVEISVAVGCRKDDDVCNLECLNNKVCREEKEQAEIEGV